MRKYKFLLLFLAGLFCLLPCSSAQAQQAFGYASITFDESTNTATGYASTELDYETAYYYNAEVQAHIEDENGNVLGSGQATGNPVATTFFDVVQFVLCFRISIISYVIVAPHFIGCDGHYFDIFGFSDFWFGWWWDFGHFSLERRNRCILGRLIFIATIIHDLIRCLPAQLSCQKEPDSNQLLPFGLRAGKETPYLTGLNEFNNSDRRTIACLVTQQGTGEPISGVSVRFELADPQCHEDDEACTGGHRRHGGRRPLGSWEPRAVVRTGSDGWARSVYIAPNVSGRTLITMTAADAGSAAAAMEIIVPGMRRLPEPIATEGYVLVGSGESGNNYHRDGHYGTLAANNGLRAIAEEYRNTAFPNGQTDDFKLRYNDQSLVRGGKFDVTPNFRVGAAPSWLNHHHDEHRVGINCDVRLSDVPPGDVVLVDGRRVNRRSHLENIFEDRGSTDTGHEFSRNHWHLRFEFGNPRAVATVGSVPIDEVPAAVPGVIEAERYDNTGNDGTVGSFVPDDGNNPSDILVYNYPQVLPITGNEEEGYVPTAGGQWMNYTVTVASTGSYSFVAKVASANSWNTFHVEVDGVDRTGSISIPNTGSGDVYQFVTVNDIWLDAGQRVIRVVIDGTGEGKGNFDYFTINPYYPPQFCNPEWWEIQDCQNSGGSWDYGLCACNYGWYYY